MPSANGLFSFADLVAQVISDTGRPDLGFATDGGDGQIPSAIFASTLAMHTLDNFWRDITAADVIFDTAAYIQTLDVQDLPRFRQLAYFRKWDPTFSASQLNPNTLPPLFNGISTVSELLALKQLRVIDLGGIFDSYGTEKQDVCYAAGSTIFIKSSTSVPRGKVGYYSYPFLDIPNDGAGYVSWIADTHPWAIIHHAKATVFANTGDLDRARELVRPAIPARDDPGGLVAQAIAALKMSNIEAEGR